MRQPVNDKQRAITYYSTPWVGAESRQLSGVLYVFKGTRTWSYDQVEVFIFPNVTPKILVCFQRTNNKMTKLQIINTFLTERLMAALNEIMDMIGGTVLQYETELESIQKDNEYLRRRLKEIEKQFESNGILSLS